MSYSPKVTTRRAVTYSGVDGAFVTQVVESKKQGHALLARRSKRNVAPGRLSDISTSSKTLLSPSPGKTLRPVARSGTKPSSFAVTAAAKKQSEEASNDDEDILCSLFSTKVKVTDSVSTLASETMGSKRLSPMPKHGRYIDLIESFDHLSPVKRSTRLRKK